MRLFRRRKDAMEIWLEESNATRDVRRWTPDRFEHAPDLDPSDVDVPKRLGFDGRPLPKAKGAITGLEGGGISPGQHHYGG
jgi:hypothetical protein